MGFVCTCDPLTAREIFEMCVISTCMYGTENIGYQMINLLENFQAEIGCRILHLPKHHSKLLSFSLSWPSATSGKEEFDLARKLSLISLYR